MTSIALLWLPILLSAVFVFVVSSVIHMVTPMHKGDYDKLPNEDATLAALRQTGVGPGQYMFPRPSSMKDMGSPEMKTKFAQGPVGTMIVRPPHCMNMGTALAQWFAFCLLIGVFVAYLTGLSVPRGAEGGHVFRVAATVAMLGYSFSSVVDSIWKGVAWRTTVKFVVDGVLYALATGATFAWLWPALV